MIKNGKHRPNFIQKGLQQRKWPKRYQDKIKKQQKKTKFVSKVKNQKIISLR